MKPLVSQRDYLHEDQIEECILFTVCIIVYCVPCPLNDIRINHAMIQPICAESAVKQ